MSGRTLRTVTGTVAELIARADEFGVSFLNQPDLLAGRQPNRRRDRGNGNVHRIAPPFAVHKGFLEWASPRRRLPDLS